MYVCLMTYLYVYCRPNLDELVSQMKALGASEVVTEEFAASHKMKDLVAVRSYSNIVHHILYLFATIVVIRTVSTWLFFPLFV